MYTWIWRHLPGNLPVRTALALALLLTAMAVLWYWAFPWAYIHFPLDSVGMAP
jgi:hypothetical protein